MKDFRAIFTEAVSRGDLLSESAANLEKWLADSHRSSTSSIDEAAISELVDDGQWQELNDRFFRSLKFGTGGLRGRSIGRVVTEAERGTPSEQGRPQYPCVGSNALNASNVSRATQGLVNYVKAWAATQKLSKRPAIAVSHDTRHFSREFAELVARVAADLGCDVYLFEAARSTPELSFAVRYFNAQAGVMLTASHNPPHDNGYKVYFADGGQIVEPHASGIIAEVNALESSHYDPMPEEDRGRIHSVGGEVDRAYLERLETLVLQPEMVAKDHGLKVVFTPIHGTGAIIGVPALQKLGFTVVVEPDQGKPDGRFPTVKSPNPENREALERGISLAQREGGDVVIGTDPDADRMGVAVRDPEGKMVLLTGNQIGSLLAYYRIRTYFELGVLDESNRDHAVLVKTFVTTELQSAIAQHYQIPCVNTLTGFKYIGQKMEQYEQMIPEDLRKGYRSLSEEETRALRLAHSRFFVFGGEESYGYAGGDFVRDKDANAAVVMFAELAAYAKDQGLTVVELLDRIYTEFGYFLERGESLVMEGAEGAAQIEKLATSYAQCPPEMIDGVAVAGVRDFYRQDIDDEEGQRLPKEKMLFVDLADGRRFAVRPSGTEPKIKYYLYYRCDPDAGDAWDGEQLAANKAMAGRQLDALWEALREDAEERIHRS